MIAYYWIASHLEIDIIEVGSGCCIEIHDGKVIPYLQNQMHKD